MGETVTRSRGSRTAGYLVAWLLASVPLWLLAVPFVGMQGAWAAVAVAWAIGLVWLGKKRQDDPGWDARLPDGRA